jgi:hypothetical protein
VWAFKVSCLAKTYMEANDIKNFATWIHSLPYLSLVIYQCFVFPDYHTLRWLHSNMPWENKHFYFRTYSEHIVLSSVTRCMQLHFVTPWTCVDYSPFISLLCKTDKNDWSERKASSRVPGSEHVKMKGRWYERVYGVLMIFVSFVPYLLC